MACKFGCDAEVKAHGMCAGHLGRWTRGIRGAELKKPIRGYEKLGFEAAMKKSFEGSLEEAIYKLLLKSKKGWSVDGLSDRFNVGVSKIRVALEALKTDGKNVYVGEGVEIARDLPPTHEPTRIDVSKFRGRAVRFGLTADNHLCSKYARNEILEALFDIWESQGIKDVYQLGNMIDGEARFNRHDLLTPPGMESQIKYFLENWPERKGITTHFICGDDHEGWYVQNFGVDVGRVIENRAREAGRTDLKYLGYMEHDIILQGKNGSSKMRLIHAGGGSTYAISYTVQKIVESYNAGEKPAILLVGHFHKAEYSYVRDVHAVQSAATQEQSPFMRKKRIQSMLGGWTISFEVDDNGVVHGFTPQFHNFFDPQFYKKWGYQAA
jgi:hypothetical protein